MNNEQTQVELEGLKVTNNNLAAQVERLQDALKGAQMLVNVAKKGREKAEAQVAALVEAGSCIQHWHDALYNPATKETEGMVVSAEHVRRLWEAIKDTQATAEAHNTKVREAAVLECIEKVKYYEESPYQVTRNNAVMIQESLKSLLQQPTSNTSNAVTTPNQNEQKEGV